MAYLKIDYFSEILNKSMQMAVILPEIDSPDSRLWGYKSIGFNDKGKIPVLYLLHGMTDNYSTWLRNTSIERYASERGIAVILPDCYLGWYTDMKNGYQYFNFLTKELPDIVYHLLPCISERKEETFIAGNSMGAYGAFKAALLCPDKYMAAGGLSGGYNVSDHILDLGFSTNGNYWTDIFGDEHLRDNDISEIARKEANSKQNFPSFYMWCGQDDWLIYQNHKLKDVMKKLGYDITYTESNGEHSWKDWDKQICIFMDWIKQILEEV